MPAPNTITFQALAGYALKVRYDLSLPDRARVSLTVPALDSFLGGGLPCGAITEIFGRHSSGRTTLAHVLITATIRSGGFAAWIDLPNSFDPECTSDRVLWVSPRDCCTAVRAVEHVLETGGFQVVILDLNGPALQRVTVPASRWLRMARAAARCRAVIVVLSATHIAGTFAALSLEASPRRRIFAGGSGPCPVFEGIKSSLHVRKRRYGSLGTPSIDLLASIEG